MGYILQMRKCDPFYNVAMSCIPVPVQSVVFRVTVLDLLRTDYEELMIITMTTATLIVISSNFC